MTKVCTHCSRVNPSEALYCYWDGSSLAGGGAEGPLKVGSQAFPTPFVFPSGQACKNFDQLALTCQQNWEAARDLLAQGYLEKFLGGLGRLDLAQAAQAAKQAPNLDRGLDQLLSRLPADSLQAPRLSAEPSQLNLGQLKVGADGKMDLHLVNHGMRLLYGSVVSNCAWLVVSEGAGTGQRLFQFQDEAHISVKVRGKQLRAGNQPLEGRLIIESNGGSFEVVVKADVPVTPFPDGVLAGATTPRQIAHKAKNNSKDAIPLFEAGAVAKWYEANGWIYPVQGPSGKGLGAVQQFFEALGLVKAPKVEISDSRVSLKGKQGANVRYELRVLTKEKKPVWANGRSDAPWLVVGKPIFNGPAVTLPLEVPHVPNERTGEVLSARVTVMSNGNQRFVVPVELTVGKRTKAKGPAATADALDEIVAVEAVGVEAPPKKRDSAARLKAASSRSSEELVDIVAVEAAPAPAKSSSSGNAFAGLTAASSAPAKSSSSGAFADLGGASANPFAAVGSDDTGGGSGLVAIAPSVRRRSSGGMPWGRLLPAGLLLVGMIAMVVIDALAKGPVEEPPPPVAKTPDKVEIKDEDDVFKAFQVEDGPTQFAKQPPVKVMLGKDELDEKGAGPRAAPIDPNPWLKMKWIKAEGGGPEAGPVNFGLALTKAAGLGESKRLTFSQSKEPDGANNNTGVYLNGEVFDFGKGGNWLAPVGGEIRPEEIRHVWALAGRKDVKDGKAVYIDQHLELMPSKQPVKVDGADKRVRDNLQVRWVFRNRDDQPHKVGLRIILDTMVGDNDNVPFTFPGSPQLIQTKAQFEGIQVPDFLQALEHPSFEKPGTIAHMTLRLGGGIEPPTKVLLTKWPGPSNSLWEVPYVDFGGDSAVVLYWEPKELKPNERREIGFAYGLGKVDTKAAGTLGLSVGGSFDPHFTITAYVKNPKQGQTLKLELSEGLQRTEYAETQAVPAVGAGPQQTSIVTWKAKVTKPGECTVTVRSSDGQVQSKNITISRPEGGLFALQLQPLSDPPFEPGKEFRVIAQVKNPVLGQAMTLSPLPKGLELVDIASSPPRQVLREPNAENVSTVSWKVKIHDVGRFPVRVVSSTGVAMTKTLVINRGEIGAGEVKMALVGDIGLDKKFQVVANVTDPLPGQTVSLVLPPELVRLSENALMVVPPAEKGKTSSVSWEVQVQKEGKFPVAVESSNGMTVKKTLTIAKGQDLPGNFKLELIGDFKKNQTFLVKATVANPAPGQKLTLQLPKGIALQDKDKKFEREVAEAVWQVRIMEAGELRLSVESSTGITKSKKIIVPSMGIFN